jgi:hypothetical protein
MIDPAHIALLQTAAEVHAHRIVRDLRLPACDREDIRQDLLVEMLPRLAKYDSNIAKASTFVSLLARHASSTLRRRLASRRKLEPGGSLPLDEFNHALSDHCDGGFSALDLSLSVRGVLRNLPGQLRALASSLKAMTTAEVKEVSRLRHATFYRRLRDIRLAFLMADITPTR